MSTPLPPIYRDCRRFLVLTEDMVRRFSRYHKYTVGTDLRQSAMAIMRTVNQAVHDKPRQAQGARVFSCQNVVFRFGNSALDTRHDQKSTGLATGCPLKRRTLQRAGGVERLWVLRPTHAGRFIHCQQHRGMAPEGARLLALSYQLLFF